MAPYELQQVDVISSTRYVNEVASAFRVLKDEYNTIRSKNAALVAEKTVLTIRIAIMEERIALLRINVQYSEKLMKYITASMSSFISTEDCNQ